MFARLSLASGLLACALLLGPATASADHHAEINIGVPGIEIYAPPLSLQIGPPPLYRPYYYPQPYYPAPYYYYPEPAPAPLYYYSPRYYPPRYYPPHWRGYHRGQDRHHW